MKAVTVVNVWKISLKGHKVKHQDVRSYRGHAGPWESGWQAGPCFHCEHTMYRRDKHKEEGAPSWGEGALGSYSGITRQRTQERTGKRNSLHTVWPSSKGQGPVWFKEICKDHCLWDMLLATEYAPSLQACSRHWIGSLRYNEQEQNTHQKRAELVLDLLSLRVKCHLYFEFSGLESLVRAPRRLVSWGHCPLSPILSGSCYNFVGKQEAKSLPGPGVALAFYNDEFLLFCSSFMPKMKGVIQTENETGNTWGLESSLEKNQTFPTLLGRLTSPNQVFLAWHFQRPPCILTLPFEMIFNSRSWHKVIIFNILYPCWLLHRIFLMRSSGKIKD